MKHSWKCTGEIKELAIVGTACSYISREEQVGFEWSFNCSERKVSTDVGDVCTESAVYLFAVLSKNIIHMAGLKFEPQANKDEA